MDYNIFKNFLIASFENLRSSELRVSDPRFNVYGKVERALACVDFLKLVALCLMGRCTACITSNEA